MNKKHVAIALLVGALIGAAYGRKIPVLSTVAAELPMASA